jgi:hypothetical protein
MPALSSQYLRRRRAIAKRAELHERALYAAVLLNADPDNADLKEALTAAGDALLRADEKIEYLDALIDEGRAPSRRVRPTDAPKPLEILARHQREWDARERKRGAQTQETAPLFAPITLPVPKKVPAIPLLTFEDAKAASDRRRAKEDARAEKSAAKKEIRRQKAAAYARNRRAALKANSKK